jgi:UDP-glucose:(heptosyl)LPS alpha-1,3-glucosyltransferase
MVIELNSTPLQIIQIVRNWGPVGGMESYVWHLSHELAKSNCLVTVICEQSCKVPDHTNIKIIEIGQLRPKPRWLMYRRFAKKVDDVIQELGAQNFVIHSHERSISHDITTFHSMPFATIKDKGWWKRLSIRAWSYLRMEATELGIDATTGQIKDLKIIPVSSVIATAIQKYYPQAKSNIQTPITPGVSQTPKRLSRQVPRDGGTIGFIGKEWARKGFEQFTKIAQQLNASRPNIKLLVLGPEKEQVRHLCANYSGDISFLGWQASANYYQELDLLIHPASSEAYGMVITEAMASHVPVLVSSACGAASDVSSQHGSVLDLKNSLGDWVAQANHWLDHANDVTGFERPWSQVANEYLAQYQLISKSK